MFKFDANFSSIELVHQQFQKVHKISARWLNIITHRKIVKFSAFLCLYVYSVYVDAIQVTLVHCSPVEIYTCRLANCNCSNYRYVMFGQISATCMSNENIRLTNVELTIECAIRLMLKIAFNFLYSLLLGFYSADSHNRLSRVWQNATNASSSMSYGFTVLYGFRQWLFICPEGVWTFVAFFFSYFLVCRHAYYFCMCACVCPLYHVCMCVSGGENESVYVWLTRELLTVYLCI